MKMEDKTKTTRVIKINDKYIPQFKSGSEWYDFYHTKNTFFEPTCDDVEVIKYDGKKQALKSCKKFKFSNSNNVEIKE